MPSPLVLVVLDVDGTISPLPRDRSGKPDRSSLGAEPGVPGLRGSCSPPLSRAALLTLAGAIDRRPCLATRVVPRPVPQTVGMVTNFCWAINGVATNRETPVAPQPHVVPSPRSSAGRGLG